METKPLTVGELRKALDGVPDDLEVRLSSDTGVDQGEGVVKDSPGFWQYQWPGVGTLTWETEGAPNGG